jgi:UDP-perosamine 4-acetyltransferase
MKPLAAISHDTSTYHDLTWFARELDISISQITPEDFLKNPSSDYLYINLVTIDMALRQNINQTLNNLELDRFSYVHPTSTVCQDVSDLGILMYPNCAIYPNVDLGQDIIIHSNTSIGHNACIGKGTFFSGGVTIGGNAHIGNFNWFGLSVTVYDKVRIADHVKLGARSVVKDNISESGTYGTVFTTKKLFQK